MKSEALTLPRETITPPQRIPHAAKVFGSFAVGLAAVDCLSGPVRWRNPNANIGTLDDPPYAAGNELPDEEWIVLPGLGVPSGREIARLLPFRNVSYLKLPEFKPSCDKVSDTLNEHIERRGLDTVNFYCHSMGGILLSRVADKLPDGLTFGKVLFDGTPTGIDDVTESYARLARLIASSRYPGGVASSLLAAWLMYRNDPELPMVRNLSNRFLQAIDRVGPNGGATATYRWQLDVTCYADPQSMGESLQQRITDNTRFAYALPDNPDNDGVVKALQAINKLEKYVTGRSIARLAIENGGHGISEKTAPAYAESITGWILNPDTVPA